MSDELERLEKALRGMTPNPSAEARQRAIDAAAAEFDRHHQGIREAARHKGRASKHGIFWLQNLKRRFTVPTSRTALAVTGLAFVVVAGVVFRQLLLAPPALLPGVPPAELPDSADLSASLPPGEATSQLHVDPASPPAELPPPGMKGITQEELAEVLERLEPRSPAEPVAAPPEVVLPTEAPQTARRLAERRRQSESLRRSTRLRSEADVLEPSVEFHSLGQDLREGRDRFSRFDANPVKVTAEEAISTFSIDVDTASYGFMRAALQNGVLPQRDAVRTEELVNYFPYDYPPPETRERPFAVHVSLMPSPWNAPSRLMHIGIKGYVADRRTAPRANLVFLIDTSGSMDAPNKLPLLVNAFRLLVSALSPQDTVAILTYAGTAGLELAPTQVAERGKIVAALERLAAGGSTAGGEGIRQAYLLAEQHFVADGVNRVILATDGDFNVGITDPGELESFIARKRDSGVFLSVLGFGMGNYNDELMQRLAQNGNGNAAYIDSLSEARKVLVEEGASTLFPIAKDVKIQVEFNPALVSEYRLIGYETRMLQREDFRNDKVDAGEIGVGHTVTAIYEVTPAGSGAERIAPLRYQEQEEAMAGAEFAGEYAYLKIRYKLPDSNDSTEIVRAVTQDDAFESIESAPREARFAAAVAAFGQLLRGGKYTGDFSYDDVIALANGARGEDSFGYRSEFINLARLAQSAAAMMPSR